MGKKKAAKAEEANTEPGVPVGSNLSEINTPEGLEPKPGVDTTAEGLAKKYKQDMPEGVKPVLGKDATNAKKAAETANANTAGNEPPKAPAARTNAASNKNTGNKGTTSKKSGNN